MLPRPGLELFGASYDAVAAVADRLALALLALLAALALAWAAGAVHVALVRRHADRLLAQLLRWSRAHRGLATRRRWSIRNWPESASLLVLAARCSRSVGPVSPGSPAVLERGGPLLLDRWIAASMRTLRNPLADRLMAALACARRPRGDGAGLVALALLWLLWKALDGGGHWLAALGFRASDDCAARRIDPHAPPPGANAAFGFPSIAVTMATIAFGFLRC